MSTGAFWSEVAECQRLLRHHRQVRDEVKKPSRARRFARWFLPWAVIPMLVLPVGWDLGEFIFWIGSSYLLLLPLLFSLAIHAPLRLTTFEALRMPSRRALYVARLLPLLPWWLWCGFCVTAVLLVSHWGMVRNGERAALYLLIGAQVPWLVLGLFGAALILVRRWGLVLFGAWFGTMFLSGLANAAGLPLGQALSPYLATVPLAMLLLEVGLLALQVWGLNRLEPMRQITGLIRQVPQPGPAHQERPVPHGGVPGKLGPSPLLAARHGLGWAAAYYALFRLLGNGFRGLVYKLSMPVVLLVLTLSTNSETDWWWWYWIVFLNLFLSGSVLHIDHPQRLYLLGVDYRRQLLYRLSTFWITPGLLAVAVGVVLSFVLWGTREMPLTLLALAASLALFREGWIGWPAVKGPWSLLFFNSLFLWLLYLIVAGHWLPGPRWDTATRVQLFAAACGACGLAGIASKWWCFDEAALVEASLPAVVLHPKP
jgi:hypothetical protein